MPSWITWDYKCEKCEHIETHMQDREDVPDYEYCVAEGCSGQAFRMYGGFISTSKTSETIPDGVGKGRFSKVREQQLAKRHLSMAKQTGDKETQKLARKELAQVKRSKS